MTYVKTIDNGVLVWLKTQPSSKSLLRVYTFINESSNAVSTSLISNVLKMGKANVGNLLRVLEKNNFIKSYTAGRTKVYYIDNEDNKVDTDYSSKDRFLKPKAFIKTSNQDILHKVFNLDSSYNLRYMLNTLLSIIVLHDKRTLTFDMNSVYILSVSNCAKSKKCFKQNIRFLSKSNIISYIGDNNYSINNKKSFYEIEQFLYALHGSNITSNLSITLFYVIYNLCNLYIKTNLTEVKSKFYASKLRSYKHFYKNLLSLDSKNLIIYNSACDIKIPDNLIKNKPQFDIFEQPTIKIQRDQEVQQDREPINPVFTPSVDEYEKENIIEDKPENIGWFNKFIFWLKNFFTFG